MQIQAGRILAKDGRWLSRRELLEEAKQRILAESALYCQSACAMPNRCGTQGCVAGHMTSALDHKLDSWNVVPFKELSTFLDPRHVYPLMVLGRAHPWIWLFGGSWSYHQPAAKAQAAYERANTKKDHRDMALAACMAIDVFIEEIEADEQRPA